jgi:hypothetical protein
MSFIAIGDLWRQQSGAHVAHARPCLFRIVSGTTVDLQLVGTPK